jgi:uncharacterized membrane protein
MKAFFRASLAAAVVWLVYFLRGNVYFRLYPVAVCAAVFAAFLISAFRTPIVELVARKRYGALDEEQTAYCRKVNNCWIVFLSAHLAVTAATVFMPLRVWAFYNGFLAYVLFGLMFLGERLVRRRKEACR